jgi:predicted HicB family RNase H-like nuclease
MVKSDTLNLRVSSEFKRRLMEEAAKEKRSVTNYLEATLTALWDRKNPEVQGKLKKESTRR